MSPESVKGSLKMKQKKILKQNCTTSLLKDKKREQQCSKKWGHIK